MRSVTRKSMLRQCLICVLLQRVRRRVYPYVVLSVNHVVGEYIYLGESREVLSSIDRMPILTSYAPPPMDFHTLTGPDTRSVGFAVDFTRRGLG